MLSEKYQSPDWDQLINYDFDKIQADENLLEKVIEEAYPLLISSKIDINEDPQATKKNIAKLFTLTQLGMELKNIFLEQAETQIRTLETTLEVQEEELRRFRTLSLGPDSLIVAAELKSLEESISDLEFRNERLNLDLIEITDSFNTEKEKSTSYQSNLSEEKIKNSKLELQLTKLKRDFLDTKSKSSSTTDKNSPHTIEYKNMIKEKNQEINRYINEVQALSLQNQKLTDEVADITVELEATVMEIDKNAVEQESVQRILLDNDHLIDKLTYEKDNLKYQLSELSEQLLNRESNDGSLMDELHQEVARHKKSARESNTTLFERTSEISRLKIENKAIKEELKTLGIDSIRKEISDGDDAITTLKTKLQGAYKDIELLSLDWDKMDSLLQTQKTESNLESIKDNFEQVRSLKDKMNAYRQKRKEDIKRMKITNDNSEEKEKELIELRKRVDQFENGEYGLTEAMREIKNLKIQKGIRDKEISQNTKQINDYELQIGEFLEENKDFRKKLGLEEDTEIDLSNLRSHTLLELHGDKAIALGLTIEDLIAVEDYTEKLRNGVNESQSSEISPQTTLELSSSFVSSPFKSSTFRPSFDNKQLDKLVFELERTHHENQETRDALRSADSKLQKIKEENISLENVIKEISLTLIKTRGGNLSGNHQFEDDNFTSVKKLIKVLEHKEKRSKALQLEGAHAADDIMEINISLRDECAEFQSTIERLTKEKNAANLKYQTLEEKNRELKEKNELPRKRILHFPNDLSLSTVHDYTALVEQLIECLLELQTKDKELLEYRSNLENYHEKFAVVLGRQKLLYKDYHEQQVSHTKEMKEIKEKLTKAIDENEISLIKIEGLENAISVFDKGLDDETSRALVIAKRNIITLKSNELILVRRHKAISEVETHLRKQNLQINADIQALDKTARETILRLIVSKNEQALKIETLLKKIDESVPANLLAQADNRLESYVSKTRILLEREQEWICKRTTQDSELLAALELKEENEKLQLQYSEAEQTASKLEEALCVLSNQFASGGPISREQIVQANRTIASLEVKIGVFGKRAEIAEYKWKMAEQVQAELNKRLDVVDRLYIETMEENMRLKDTEMDLKNSFEGGADRETNNANIEKISNLIKINGSLKNDIMKYKNLSDIASHQASDLIRLHAVDEKEKQVLNAAIQELQMEGEEKLLIGKMHHHIVALQISEAVALRKVENLSEKCLKLEANVVQLEKNCDEKDNHIYQMHLDGKTRVRILQGIVSDLRARMSGVVLLSKHERTCNLVQTLFEKKTAMAADVRKILTEKHNVEDKFVEALEKMKIQDQLIIALQEKHQNVNMIVAWHKKMADDQLSKLKLQREVMHLKQTEAMALRELEEVNARSSMLELDLVNLQSSFDQDRIVWEQRGLELELKVSQYEEERERIFQAASSAELKEALPDRTLPIYKQLEVALRLLVERTRLLAAQDIRIADLMMKLDTYKSDLGELEHQNLDTEYQLINLKKNSATFSLDSGKEKEELEIKYRAEIRKREDDAMKAAQGMIASLRRQLKQKGDMVEKYQKMMIETREKMGKLTDHDKNEIEILSKTIENMSDKQVDRLKNYPSNHRHENKQQNLNEVEDLENVIGDLEKLIQIKEEEVNTLKNKFQDLEISTSQDRLILLEKIERLNNDILTKVDDLAHQETTITKLDEQIVELKAMADHAAYRELEEIVFNLKKQLAKKERDHTKHLRAISELKKALYEYSTKDVIKKDEAEETQSATISRLETKIDRLRIATDKYRNENSILDQKNKSLQQSVQKLGEEATKKTKDLSQLNSDFNRFQQLLKEKDKRQIDFDNQLKRIKQEKEFFQQKLDETISNGKVASQQRAVRSIQKTDSASQTKPEVISKNSDSKKDMLHNIKDLEKLVSEKDDKLRNANEDIQQLKSKLSKLKEKKIVESSSSESLQKSSMMTEKEDTSKKVKLNQKTKQKPSTEFEDYDVLDKEKEVSLFNQLDEHRNTIFDLEKEIDKWKMIANVEKSNEIKRILRKCKQLHEKNAELEELNAKFRHNLILDNNLDENAKKGDRSANMNQVLESRVKNLIKINQTLEEENAIIKEDIEKTHFERDQSIQSEKRAERRISEIKESLKLREEEFKEAIQNGPTPLFTGLTIPLAYGDISKVVSFGTGKKGVQDDLVKVIEHLSSEIEKFKGEVEFLKKGAPVSNMKYMELLKECKRLKKDKIEQDACVRSRSNFEGKLERLEMENGKLLKQTKKQTESVSKHSKELLSIQVERDGLKKEINSLQKTLEGLGYATGSLETDEITRNNTQSNSISHSNCCREILELKRLKVEQDGVIQALMNPSNSKIEELNSEIRRITREMDMWKSKVQTLTFKLNEEKSKQCRSDLDLEFLIKNSVEKYQCQNEELREELSDVKHNYKELLRLNLEFERRREK